MPINDALGKRMKHNYEEISKTRLTRRTPVAIRIDGKAFHTFCRNLSKPFDDILIKSMQDTMLYLCENIQGCAFGYTQSDEITLILIDYQKLESAAWFDYEVQKICSISASMATMIFNKMFREHAEEYRDLYFDVCTESEEIESYIHTLEKCVDKGAMFDARCFNIPKEEVGNLLYWRQIDATRNSIQMVGQANFSHKELHGLNCNKIQDKLFTEKDINWNNFPIYKKRGTTCYKDESGKWILDEDCPIFKNDWEYIDRHIFVGE